MNVAFDEIDFTVLLPEHLRGSESKDQLKNALKQFHVSEKTEKVNYADFYTSKLQDYFLQGDLISEVRFPKLDRVSYTFEKAFTTAVIISNTCDIAKDNERKIISKECLFAPVITLEGYVDSLKNSGRTEQQILNHKQELFGQKISNLFYLPFKDNWEDGNLALLDQMFWFPTDELNNFDVSSDRVSCFDQFGFYLFVLKISYHLCQLPEQPDRV